MLKRTFLKEKGFTFVELLAALAINGFIFAALLSIFISNLNHHQISVNTNRLNQQLETALDLMTNEIRRAGYWLNAQNDIGLHQNNNPFQVSASTDISIPVSTCILISYDRDNNGTLPASNSAIDDERYGFKLRNGALQARPPGAAFNCNSNDWENVTDPNVVNITNLSFTLTTLTRTTGPGTRGVQFRSVDIAITGQLVGNSSVTRTLTQHVRIRNDKFIP